MTPLVVIWPAVRFRWPILAAFLLVASAAVLAADASGGAKRYPSLKLGGFTDFSFFAAEEDDAGGTRSGFKEGQFILHFVSEVGERWDFFAETSLSARRGQDFKAALERGIIKYSHNDALKISFGRYHTPINWWNDSFHHGQWLQTTVDRPEMTRFGGEFIPVHFVGGMVQGNIPSGQHNLKYRAGIGNGRSDPISGGGDAGDVNNSRALFVTLASRPGYLYGLEFGAAYYVDKITQASLTEEFDEWIGSLFAVLNRETPEVIIEYAHIDRKGEDTGSSFTSNAYYVQVAQRLPFWHSRLKPYVRYEKINVGTGEPVFVTQMDREGFLVGARLDFSAPVAVKLEYRHQRTNEDPYVDALVTQISLAF